MQPIQRKIKTKEMITQTSPKRKSVNIASQKSKTPILHKEHFAEHLVSSKYSPLKGILIS